MTKHQFLEVLGKELCKLPTAEVQNSLDYYGEMIDDRMESGMSEAQAVRDVGDPRAIAKQILLEMPLPKLIKTKYQKKSAWRVWEIILLVLGSPIWLSLAVALLAVILAVYICVWAVFIVLWAVEIALFAGVIGCAALLVTAIAASPLSGLVMLGAALAVLGLAILCFVGCLKLTKIFVKISIQITKCIKYLIVGKG